ncbi:MAG: helix-turn-helix domain-containing protein [Armatimonadota bacterium]|nr:helix-turn-helix domain-containing protein [Armatimonadota bacterium]
MSTLESKLEAWLKFVAKQEEAIKAGSPTEQPEPQAEQTPAPAAPAAYTPASSPTLAPTPTVTTTIIDRRPAQPLVPEPEIPEMEDFLPILRRRVAPPPIPEMVKPQVDEKPMPQVAQTAAPAPPAPVISRPSVPEATLFAPPVIRPITAPVAVPPRPRVQNKPIEPPAQLQTESAQEMWDRLPKHVQLLVGMHPNDVTQRSYKRFKESRDELIQRLLDPPLTLEDTARILNVCPTTVRRYTNRDSLKHFRTAGNQRRFKLSDVLAFMESEAAKKAE